MTEGADVTNADDKLFEVRFDLNMKRVGALIDLVAPKSPAAHSDPLESDISRAIVVFLHATFEDLLRTAGRRHAAADSYWDYVNFSSHGAVETALVRMGLDTEPFKFLELGLDSMIKRRHRIVHDADLPNATAREAKAWGFSDNLLLMYWLLHVLAFNAQLHVSIDPADELQRWYLARRKTAIERAQELIRGLLALTQAPKESIPSGFQVMATQVAEVLALLGPPSEVEVQEIIRKVEEQSRRGGVERREVTE